MPTAKPLSVAVRQSAPDEADGGCQAALRTLRDVRIRRLQEVDSTHDLDLILDLTSRPADPDHILHPRFGYWTYLYGETPERIAPGLMEILSGQRAAYVRLARLMPGGKAVILREGSVRTVAHSLSATRGRLLEAASDWPARTLEELARSGAPPTGTEVELRTRSRAAQMRLRAWLPVALVRNVGRRIRQELTRDCWRIGVIGQPIIRTLEGFDPTAIRWLDVSFDGFLADPFGVAAPDGALTILAEAFPWKERRGRIAAIERRRDGTLAFTLTSLTFDSHLSYPQIIPHEGHVYCIPESCAQGRVQLFRALEFPRRWVPDCVLLEGFAGVDTTVIRHQERWWMFTCDHADQDESKLFIFYADELRGPWTPHPLNPVKCDLRSSRPAGTPFVTGDGTLYRPAQDCSRAYGGALVINRVTRLTRDAFAEEIAAHLRPDPEGPCPDGLHTLSAIGELTLVDGKRHELVPASIVAALKRIVSGVKTMFGTTCTRLLLGLSIAIAANTQSAPAQNWPMFGGNVQSTSANPQPTGISSANVAQLRRRQVTLDGTVDASVIYLHGVAIHGGRHNAIFLTTSYGRTLAVDADSGDILWDYTPESYRGLAGTRQFTNSTPVADAEGQFIYAASPDGYIQKLAVSDGRVLWRTAITTLPLREKMDSPLKLFRGRVIAVTAGYVGDRPPYQGHVAILDSGSGKLLRVWNSLCSNRPGLLRPSSCPQTQSAIWGRAGATLDPSDGRIFIATGNGDWNGTTAWGDALIELDRTATELLGNYTPIDTEALNESDLDLGSTSPVLLGGNLLAQGGKDGKIRLLSRQQIAGTAPHKGHELQIVSTPGGGELLSQPAVWQEGGKTWMSAADDSGTAAWQVEGGRLHEEWRNSSGGTSPFEAGGLLFVYDPAGALNVYQTSSGQRIARLQCGSGHWNSPVVVDGKIILPEGDANRRASSGVLDIWALPTAVQNK